MSETDNPATLSGPSYIAELLRSAGTRPNHKRAVGIELERIGMWPDGSTLQYSASKSPSGEDRPGMGQILCQLGQKNGWEILKSENDKPIGLNANNGKFSLEPGSQLEYSSDAKKDLHGLEKDVIAVDAKVQEISRPYGLRWITLGTNPCAKVDDVELIPVTRYKIMTKYLGERGRLATSMMRLTTSIQINLDYLDEEDGIEMLRVAMAAAPISYALFANSPYSAGINSGYLSYRRTIWKNTDPDRTGILHDVFKEGYNFTNYADYLWGCPLMYAQDVDGNYVPGQGCSLKDIAKGALPNVVVDANNQMNGIRQPFPEARLKPGFIEVRSVDGLLSKDRYAATAFWMGLLYGTDARKLVLDKLGGLSPEDRDEFLELTSKVALKAKINNLEAKTLAKELVTAAKESLKARGLGEEKYLEPIQENLEDNVCPAERILNEFGNSSPKDISALIDHTSLKTT